MATKKNQKHPGGRPPQYGKKLDTRIPVSIHKRTLQQIEEINTGGTISAFIRDAIAEKLERELKPYESNPAFPASDFLAKKEDKANEE
jgi:hypothetical protein